MSKSITKRKTDTTTTPAHYIKIQLSTHPPYTTRYYKFLYKNVENKNDKNLP